LYILRKENDRINTFSKRNNCMKTKRSFNYNILRINKNELLLINKHKLNAILRILKDELKKFLIEKKKI